jgi:hypothetical protein
MNLDRDKLLELVRRNLSPAQIERSRVYWTRSALPAGEVFKAGPQTFAMPFEGTIVFVDLSPGANWAHPCLYLLVDIRTLAVQSVEASFPPGRGRIGESPLEILRFGKEPPQSPLKDQEQEEV